MADDVPESPPPLPSSVQAALQVSQELAVRACLGALDPHTRTDEGTYVDALRRLQVVCQDHLDRLAT